MKILPLSLAFLLTLAIGDPAADDIKALTDDNNRFATELYHVLSAQDGNLLLSPFSISSALAMTYAGADGSTAEQMAKTLHFTLEPKTLHPAFASLNRRLNDNRKSRGDQLTVANSLWGQQGFGFRPDFLKLTQDHYGAGFREVDFAGATESARQTINAWVEKQTNDMIKELLKKGILNSLTRLVLANAIYFKGTWLVQFDKRKTQDAPFHLASQKDVNVPLMSSPKLRARNLDDGELQVLELPYTGKELSMVLFLPKAVDGLPALEKSLTAEKLAGWLARLREQEIDVYLPRFNITCPTRLDEALKTLGMPAAFDEAVADFSGMNGKKNLFITAVVHKAFVDVNEEGTEAAAATAVVEGVTSMPMEPKVFRADHPFLFLIRDNASGAILFLGRLSDPAQ